MKKKVWRERKGRGGVSTAFCCFFAASFFRTVPKVYLGEELKRGKREFVASATTQYTVIN